MEIKYCLFVHGSLLYDVTTRGRQNSQPKKGVAALKRLRTPASGLFLYTFRRYTPLLVFNKKYKLQELHAQDK